MHINRCIFSHQGLFLQGTNNIDDGTDVIRDLVPNNDHIRYFRLNEKTTLGAKLNLACEHARGTIIANWDDDDWYASHREGESPYLLT